jgi:hypothetical protein
MRKAWAISCCLVAAIGFGAAVQGQESKPLTVRERKPLEGPQFRSKPDAPPDAIRNVMKSNNEIMSVDGRGGEGNGAGGASQGGFVLPGTLSTSLADETQNWEAAAKDAATLKANFAQIEAFFVARKDDDATATVKEGAKAVLALEEAVQKKERVNAVRAQIAIAESCRDCHIAHRAIILSLPQSYGII